MADINPTNGFARTIQHFIAPACAAFAARIAAFSDALDPDEIKLIRAEAEEALHVSARLKLNRILLLELHAAQRAGELTAEEDAGRFAQFVEHSLRPEFAEHLDRVYPPFRRRLQHALDRQRNAIESLVARFVEDRGTLTRLLGQPAQPLTALSLGKGDLHAGGQSVARLSFAGGHVMYKPRSLRIDQTLEAFLASVFGNDAVRIYVPEVIDRGEYGWAAFVPHRYCGDAEELRAFYRRLGHWLAVLRLLGGTDIHLENLIAVGPVPVVIDVESLFVPMPAPSPSEYGHAHDTAVALIRSSVLRTGIVPLRAPALGFDGADLSAAGALPDQQPQIQVPIIVDEGTMDARLEVVNVDIATSQNHPHPRPEVSLYWDQISEGFLEASDRLRHLDAEDKLAPLLAAFADCHVRVIRRATQAYVEIARMLWHPASLYDEASAIERARDLLARNAAVALMAPSAPSEIMAEIDDLNHGDVPIFVELLTPARIETALADWRAMRVDLEEMTIRSALVATELNQRMDDPDQRDGRFYFARHPHADDLEARRRKLAANTVERLLRLAVRGDDHSVTWITPEISSSGWLVQPLQADAYFGLGGVTVALAGYLHESRAGRANRVIGVEETLEGALQVLHKLTAISKPVTVTGFNGLGGEIWTWLTLSDLLQRPQLLAHAIRCAETLERTGFDDDRNFDIIDGASGAIAPLLELAETTKDSRWLMLAARAGQRLQDAAIVDEHGARWTTIFTEPLGGFAHGVAGIAWALTRLAQSGAGDAIHRARWSALADAAFAFQDSLYDETLGNWLDVRQMSREETFHTWCNGSVGIGLAACDLYARTRNPRHLRTLRRAVAASQNQWGISHTLCHGDFSLRELFVRAAALDPAECAIDPDESIVEIVSSIEEHHGLVGGMARAAFTPGLMTGLAGAIHSLNGMHPDCRLPSPLLLESRMHREIAS